MARLESLDDYDTYCETCERARYVIRPDGDVAQARTCDQCFETCPACDGEEFVYVTDDNGYRYAEKCPVCGPLKERIRAFNIAGIPARYHGRQSLVGRFETETESGEPIGNLKQIKRRIFRWLQGFIPGEQGFLLHGQVGTGKTHLMAGIVRQLTLKKGISCQFVEFTHLLGELRAQFDRGESEAEIMDPLAEVPVLAIDELGKGQNTEWQLSIIDQLISKRYNCDKTTVLTTNFPLDDEHRDRHDSSSYSDLPSNVTRDTLRDRVGERIYSRLHEMTEFLHLDAPDYRKRSNSTR